MRKYLLLGVFIIASILTTACSKEEAVVLFNHQVITKETIASNSNDNVFKPNERIYYLVAMPNVVNKQMLLIQVYKVGSSDAERLGYDLVWGKWIKLREEQVHYYTDYLVLSATGAYTMVVRSRDNPSKILTTGDFYIKN